MNGSVYPCQNHHILTATHTHIVRRLLRACRSLTQNVAKSLALLLNEPSKPMRNDQSIPPPLCGRHFCERLSLWICMLIGREDTMIIHIPCSKHSLPWTVGVHVLLASNSKGQNSTAPRRICITGADVYTQQQVLIYGRVDLGGEPGTGS